MLKTRDRFLLKSLKDFLKVVPSSICVEQIWETAIYRLATRDLEACYWILDNPAYLMPDLDLIDFCINYVINKLKSMGFMEGKDFSIRSKGELNHSRP